MVWGSCLRGVLDMFLITGDKDFSIDFYLGFHNMVDYGLGTSDLYVDSWIGI